MKNYRIYRTAAATYVEYTTVQAESEDHAMYLVNDDPDSIDWKQGEEEQTQDWIYSVEVLNP